jgi:hypothetical protein
MSEQEQIFPKEGQNPEKLPPMRVFFFYVVVVNGWRDRGCRSLVPLQSELVGRLGDA